MTFPDASWLREQLTPKHIAGVGLVLGSLCAGAWLFARFHSCRINPSKPFRIEQVR